MNVIISSKNPVKVQAVKEAVQLLFPNETHAFEGISVPSGVSEQPMTDGETLQGAKNRAKQAKRVHPEGDLWIGIEGGIEPREAGMMAFAWIVVEGKTQTGLGRSAGFMLPPAVCRLISEGIELGEADDIVFGKSNSKQSNGAIGLLTQDLITRTTLYIPAILMALIPFSRPELYPSSEDAGREMHQ